MIFSMSWGHTFVFIHVDVQATRPSVSNWFEYNRYRTRDSASSGSFDISDMINTRGFEGKRWTVDCLAAIVAVMDSVILRGKRAGSEHTMGAIW